MANDAGDRVTPAVVTFTDTEQVTFSVHLVYQLCLSLKHK